MSVSFGGKMFEQHLAKLQGPIQGLTRIVVGLLFFSHGAQKLFGWFGAEESVELFSRMGVAGVLEFFGGAMIMLGLFTRPVAFLLSGQMAVAYFWIHQPRGLFPWDNGGELAALYSWVFLLFAAMGSGCFALDSLITRKKEDG
jgi:putative oxidoreductase